MKTVSLKMEKASLENGEKTWASYLVTRVLIVDILVLVSGIVHGWSSPVLAKLAKDADNPLGRTITVEEMSWIGSLVFLGAVVGPFIAGYFSDRIGRKKSIIGIALLLSTSFTIFAFATEIYWYIIGRFMAGVAFGGFYTIVPVYLVEISGNNNRGIVGTSAIVFSSLGQFAAVAIGPFVSIMTFNLIILIFPIVFICLFMIFNPESPHYLLKNSKEESAKSIYDRLQQTGLMNEFEEMKLFTSSNNKKVSSKEVFKRKYFKSVIPTTILICLKPLTGANVIGVYTQNIFESISRTVNSELPPIIIGAVLILASFITPLYVERVGRKTLLNISSLGILIAEVILGFYYFYKKELENANWIPVFSLFCIMLFYGVGSVVWTVLSELLPSNIKSSASAIANCFCWLVNFFVTLGFPLVCDKIGDAFAFWIFAAFNMIALVFTLAFIPETKGKSTKEAQELLA